MYAITMTGAPYGYPQHSQYAGEMLRSDIPTLRGAKRIARQALCTMDQVAHIYDSDHRHVAVVRLGAWRS